MKQKWGNKEEYQKLYTALCKFYNYLVLNKYKIVLDPCHIFSLGYQPLYTITKAFLENIVS